MKKAVYFPQVVERVADLLIADLGRGEATSDGNRISGYFVLLQGVDNEEETVTVSIIEEKESLEKGKSYYTIHCADDVTPADCDLFFSEDLSKGSLVEALMDIAREFNLVSPPKAEPEPKPTTGDWYKVKLLTAALADAARCEAEGKTFYGAYVHFTTPGVKNITIGEGGLQVLLQYYKENKDPGWD